MPVQTHIVFQRNPMAMGAGHTVVPKCVRPHKDEFCQGRIALGTEIFPRHRFSLTANLLFEFPVTVMPTATRKRASADRTGGDSIARRHVAAALPLSAETPAT